ncbi:MAG: plastocyanin/azurin family copper-binding protein [Candidatus Komeilibacteria bacterium]|nr:plastocyanin/azurin family copper-binding protein [Candidatus Komeilibacteria bacterium]
MFNLRERPGVSTALILTVVAVAIVIILIGIILTSDGLEDNDFMLNNEFSDGAAATIEATDQTVNNDNIVTVARVIAYEDGWAVVHASNNGQVGRILGFAPIMAGTNEDVSVSINTAEAGEELVVMLHVDAGVKGTFEPDTDDIPVAVNNATVMTVIKLQLEEDSMSGTEIKEFSLVATSFKYDQQQITVNKGDRVRINLRVDQGFHDWTVEGFDAATGQVGVGETTSVEFVADEAGSFTYYCSVGNHRALGMVGTLIVNE